MATIRIPRYACALGLAIALSVAATSAQATTYSWTGNAPSPNNQDWSAAQNWSPVGVPGTGDTAIITTNIHGSGFNVLVNQAVTVANLTVITSILQGVGSVTVTGAFEAQYAYLGPAGGITIASTGSLTVDPVAGIPTYNTTAIASLLTVHGSVTVNPNAVFAINSGSTVINNRYFTLADNVQLSLASSGALFVNNASFTAGNAVCYAGGSLFSNAPAGAVYVTGGKTFLMQGTFGNSGELQPQSGAVLNVSAATAFHNAAAITGPGSVLLTGSGTVDGTVTVAGRLQFNGGALTLNGTLEVQPNGYFDWLGGALSGVGTNVTGSVQVDKLASMLMNELNTLTLRNCLLTNQGQITWSNSGTVFMGYNARIDNNGYFSAYGDGSLAPLTGGGPGYTAAAFYNENHFNKSIGATNSGTTIAVPFYGGSMLAYQGNLSLTGGGMINSLDANANATIQLVGGNFTAAPNSSVSDLGTVLLKSGATLNLANGQLLTVYGTFAQTGGTIYGNGELNITYNGQFNWFAGSIALTNLSAAIYVQDHGTMNLQGGTATKNFRQGRLLNYGTVNWVNDNSFSGMNAGDNTIFDNFAQINIQCDSFINDISTTVHPVFTNENNGTITKSALTGTTSIGFKLNNAGLIVAQSGTLELYQFDDVQAQINEAIRLAGGGVKIDTATKTHGTIIGKGTLTVNGGLTSSGKVETTDGDVVQLAGDFSNDGNVVIDPGTVTMSGNNFSQTTNGTLVIPIRGTNAAAMDFGQMKIGGYGQATLAGSLVAQITDGYAPPIGATFPFLTSFQRNGTFNQVNLPAGFQLTYNPGGATLVVTGTVPVQIISPAPTNGQFQFGLNTISNRSYTVQYRDELNAGNWQFYSNFTGTGAYWPITTPNTNAHRFFRVSEP